MIPLRDDVRSRSFPLVNLTLIALNAAAFTLELGMGRGLERFFYQAAVIPALFTGRDRALDPLEAVLTTLDPDLGFRVVFKHNSLVELVLIVGVALGLALAIQAFLIKPFRIPSESMVPTLDINQRVLVDRVSGRFSEPDRGDIVVFKPPRGADRNQCGEPNHSERSACPRPTPERSDTNFIKRVVAVGGDRLSVRDGRVYINGRAQRESYARPDPSCGICNLPREITIPKGYYFMMGDNRGESADSREWGPVPEDWIIGKAFMTYWPPGKIGTL